MSKVRDTLSDASADWEKRTDAVGLLSVPLVDITDTSHCSIMSLTHLLISPLYRLFVCLLSLLTYFPHLFAYLIIFSFRIGLLLLWFNRAEGIFPQNFYAP